MYVLYENKPGKNRSAITVTTTTCTYIKLVNFEIVYGVAKKASIFISNAYVIQFILFQQDVY